METQTPLRAARIRLSLTGKSAAKRVGCHPGTYSRIERGLQTPGIELLKRIVKEFGLTEAEVLYHDHASNDGMSQAA